MSILSAHQSIHRQLKQYFGTSAPQPEKSQPTQKNNETMSPSDVGEAVSQQAVREESDSQTAMGGDQNQLAQQLVSMMLPFSGKVALITGSGRGIGDRKSVV